MPASVLAPSTDIKSTTKPAGLLELAHLLQADELAIGVDTRPDNVNITYDAEAGTATVAATLPITFALDASGKPVATAVDYLAPL
ncbi:hypothetical protein [Nodularia sp. UHCC 0506]|uniref:hypothetical protein n=1 Tax=Nodularia sp. UHCC 0506 TaxID=3110243 RepID=UPI002B1EAC74|nr:hypothetical protein [Nodularia sp. UHCC 0506]MEA5516205.1 hypothetical protein [Nodularia sp. UHCC 0506]